MANIPFLILLVPIGIVLAICMPGTLCCSKCCCEINSNTPFRFMTGMVYFVLTFIALGLAFIFLFFAFNRGSQSVKGILNVGCAAQSLVYPTPILGYNQSDSKIGLDNSSFCFNIMRQDETGESAKAF